MNKFVSALQPSIEPSLSSSELLRDRLSLAAELERRLNRTKLFRYRPYPKQQEFHAAGATHRERLLIAANQSGKSLAGGMECAMHATGRYPDSWAGKRFDRPTIGWGAGTTNDTTRDTVQRILTSACHRLAPFGKMGCNFSQ